MLLSTVDNGRPAAPATAPDAVPLRELETMVLIRVFEEEADRQYKRDGSAATATSASARRA